MELKISHVKDKSDKDNERVVISCKEDCDLGDFIIFDTTYNDEGISNKLRHSFWFPDKTIHKNDKVILYTKKGKDKEKNTESGNINHFFYWGLNETIWNEDDDGAVLVKIYEYISKKV